MRGEKGNHGEGNEESQVFKRGVVPYKAVGKDPEGSGDFASHCFLITMALASSIGHYKLDPMQNVLTSANPASRSTETP